MIRLGDRPLHSDIYIQARQQIITRRLDPSLSENINEDTAFHELNAWLLLHRGRCLCRMRSDFKQAQKYIDAALAGFRRYNDKEGEIWTLVEKLVLCYHAQDFAYGLSLFDTIELDNLQAYLQAELLFGRFLCAIGSDLLHDAEMAGHQALEALERETDPWLQRIGRIQMLRNQAAVYHYLGKSQRAVQAAEKALELTCEHPDTSEHEPWVCYELGVAYWRRGSFQAAHTMLDRARRLAEQWQHRELWRWCLVVQGNLLRDLDRLPEAREAYVLADGWGEEIHGPILLQIREGRYIDARWSSEALLQLGEKKGFSTYTADAHGLLGLIDLHIGKRERALEHFDTSAQIFQSLHYNYSLQSINYCRAAALIALGRDAEADHYLAQALHFSASEEVYTHDYWVPNLMEALLLRAITLQIEAPHAKRMLERRFLEVELESYHNQRGTHPKTELEIARNMQLSLLPNVPPLVPDLDIAGISLPAEEVGGDFYGFYPAGMTIGNTQQRSLGVALSDISGKGLASALLTSGTAVAISTAIGDNPQPNLLLQRVHSALYPHTQRNQMYVALCYSLLTQNQAGWEVQAASGGALPPLIRRANGEVFWLATGGLPIGCMQHCSYSQVSDQLEPNDTLVMISDGIVEAMNSKRELFGFEQLQDALRYAPIERGAHAILHHLLTMVQTFVGSNQQHDDLTIVVVKATGTNANDTSKQSDLTTT
jgi:Serine phosphatase RsbU, regulator of sigma subunit